MRRTYWLVILLLFLSSFAAVSQIADPIVAPSGALPTLDGTIADDEWADATIIPLGADCTLFLKHAERNLYMAIRATTMGVPSPLIARADGVYVLHASAALGTAIYEQTDDFWELQQSFVWQCRTLGFSSAAAAQRERFLAQEGWLGTIGYLGQPTEFEYVITLNELPLRMLVLFLEATDPTVLLSWPEQADVTGHLEIITGPVPSVVSFDVDNWAVLILEQE